LVSMATSCVGRELRVIAGVGTYCTRSSIEQAQQALGAHALLVELPHYSKHLAGGLLIRLGTALYACQAPTAGIYGFSRA